MRNSPPRQTRRLLACAAGAALIAPSVLTATASAAPGPGSLDESSSKTYLVQFAEPPVASYAGGVSGYAATMAGQGEEFDARSGASQRYESYLLTRQETFLSAAGLQADDTVAEYTVALNGVAVEATPSQITALRKSGQVLNVWEDEIRTADTVSTPDFLGMSGEDGVWSTEFGGAENAGEGIVVGVIDTGIADDNESFADLPGTPAPPATWNGECVTGEGDAAIECNSKLIGARWYGAEFGNTIIPGEFESPRDYGGHGSHTAGTSAGNFETPMSIGGIDIGTGSGMAPAAQIAAYKGLWQTSDGGGSGTTAGLVAAIDDATADGVDVINYSISGSRTSVVGPDEAAFLGAFDAGVFVATSAGNSGDTIGVSSVAHNSPWTTTVAASTHDRPSAKTVTTGDGEAYDGVGVQGGAEGEVVLSTEAGLPGADPTQVRQCYLDTLDPEVVDGNIVFCDRGGNARTDKSAEVAAAGGIGMIQANTTAAESLNADYHSVPSIHLPAAAGDAVRTYVQETETPTAVISPVTEEPAVAPEMAGFSSYGPALAGGGDLLKPDITGPGVDVIAAVAPEGNNGEDFFAYSGTSMSTPHVAGLAALLTQQYPDWSPAAMKSAMMTTATPLDNQGGPIQWVQGDATPLNFGAGHVRPALEYAPGLVYDATTTDWQNYVCAIGEATGCEDDVDASDVNYPSIAVGELTGTQTITRTVTDTTGEGGTWTAEVEADAGLDVVVEPGTLEVPAGGSVTFEVTITNESAENGAYSFGALTWSNGDLEVRSPIAVNPVAVAAPEEVEGTGVSGELGYEITAGFDGTLTNRVDGLVPAEVVEVEAVQGEGIADGIAEVTVPETGVLRLATYDEEVDADDIDLYLANAEGEVIGESLNASSAEEITLTGLEAGTYLVAVDIFAGPPTLTVPVSMWAVEEGAAGAGDLTVDPAETPVSIGESLDLALTWAGLEPQTRYLGAVAYENAGEQQGQTLVSIDSGEDDTPWLPVVDRWAGAQRYATAALIAEQFPDGADTVYIAAGDGYADSLTGGPAAARGMVPTSDESTLATPEGDPAPVLLVKSDQIPGDTARSLQSLEPSTIVVLGGDTRISEGVYDDLAEYVGEDSIERIDGENRYETAANLAFSYESGQDVVYVARGDDRGLADALTSGALAGSVNAPVVLVQPGQVPSATAGALEHLDPEAIVLVGGPEAVSDEVAAELGAWAPVERLFGADRYETGVVIAGLTEPMPDTLYVARGDDYADALAGSSLAGSLGEPILLVQPDHLPKVVPPAISGLEPGRIVVLGGDEAVSEAVEELLADPGTYPQD